MADHVHMMRLAWIPCAIALALAAMSGAALLDHAEAEADAAFAGGSGTSADPYLIANADQLRAFGDTVNAGNSYKDAFIALSADIDISGAAWTPIGFSTRSGSGVTGTSTPFAGTFDGNDHTISGLTITSAGSASISKDRALGLFGAVMGGTVKDLMLANVNIDAPTSELAGAAVGLLGEGGTVSGLRVSGSVSALCGCGGVVGRMTANGTIADCTNDATVTATGGTGNCGGIVGAAYYSPEGSYMAITDCVNHGTITGVNDTGGIAGLCCAFASGCTNDGAVVGSGYAVGGIAGEVKNHGGISHCTNTAAIRNDSTASPYGTGGIVGWVRYDGTAPAYALSAPVDIADNLNTSSVTANTGIGVGGIAGVVYSAGTVTGNENRAAALNGKQFVAGIVGNLQDQGASTLPASVPEGASVINNVSTTPLTSMSGTLTALYAYNNDPSLFTVSGNGLAWVAQRSSTGPTAYASLDYAVAHATDGDTVTLIADPTDTGTVEAPEGHSITLDLNGYDIAFTADGGIVADGDTLTVTGSGDLYARESDGTIIAAPTLLTTKTGSNGAEGHILLTGGTYPTDVAAFVAPGYAERVFDDPNAFGNRYEVVAASIPDQPSSSGTTTDPTQPTDPAGTTSSTQPSRPVKKPVLLKQPGAIASVSSQATAADAGVGMPPLSDDEGERALGLVMLAVVSGSLVVAIRRNGRHTTA